MPTQHCGKIMRDRATGVVGRVFGECSNAADGSPRQLQFRMSRADGTEVRATFVDVPTVEEKAQFVIEERRR
jgi:hypothetical protein